MPFQKVILFLEWQFEDKLIKPSDHYKMKTYETDYYRQKGLWIRNLTESGEGFYICRNADNGNLSAEKFQLEVDMKPNIFALKTKNTEGEELLVDCSASGNSEPDIQ